MAQKKLTPETLQLVKDEIKNYQYHLADRNNHPHLSAAWFKSVQTASGCYALVQQLTGLTMKHVDLLTSGEISINNYYNQDGTKKENK